MKDTSPQVHPTGVEHGFNNGVAGMTLLQYYAGQAMQGMCDDVGRYNQYDLVAKNAFRMAETMLEEYNKRYGGNND